MNQHPDLRSQASLLGAAAMNPMASLSSVATTFLSGLFVQEAAAYFVVPHLLPFQDNPSSMSQ
jgi:hypothetical protein